MKKLRQTFLLTSLAAFLGACSHTPGSGSMGASGNNDEVITGLCFGGTDMHHGGAQGALSLRSAGLLGSNLPPTEISRSQPAH